MRSHPSHKFREPCPAVDLRVIEDDLVTSGRNGKQKDPARIDDPLHLLHRLQIPVRQINSAAAANALQLCLELFVVQCFCGREVEERQGEG